MNNSLDFAIKCLLPGDLNRLFTMVQEEKLAALGPVNSEAFALGAAIGFGYYQREEEMRHCDKFIFRYSKVSNAGKEYGELLADVIYEVDEYRLVELQNILMTHIMFGLASAPE